MAVPVIHWAVGPSEYKTHPFRPTPPLPSCSSSFFSGWFAYKEEIGGHTCTRGGRPLRPLALSRLPRISAEVPMGHLKETFLMREVSLGPRVERVCSPRLDKHRVRRRLWFRGRM